MRKVVIIAIVAVALTALGCETTPTQEGAVVGGALGAGLGAIIGHQSGHQGEGALIGAGAGALTGALVGDQVDEQQQRPAPTTGTRYSAPPSAQGHYEMRTVKGISGETYEERVWVPGR
jgi:uncharacterized protein YcfJ